MSLKKKSDKIVAYGEVTGHYHELVGDCTVLVDDKGEVKEASLDKDCEIQHQEHGTFTVPAQDYEIGGVQEYDPFEQIAKRVVD